MLRPLKKILAKSGYHSKPDFMIVGAQKAGTTGLFDTLIQHSSIKCSSNKEIHYFSNNKWYGPKTLWEYHCYFPLPLQIPRGTKLFEASACYLNHPQVARRLYEYNPNLKVIVMLRAPEARAFSAWTMHHHQFRTGRMTFKHDPRSFTEVVTDELENWSKWSYEHYEKAYIQHGLYCYHIEEYLKYFSREQICFVENTDMLHNFDRTINHILSFVGVAHEELSLAVTNKSVVQERDKYVDDIRRLRDFYRPHNERLFKLIGRELPSFLKK
jgi:hypothetical protein